MSKSRHEPTEAFPYRPPTDAIKQKYEDLFNYQGPFPNRIIKSVFDRIISILVLFIAIPILLILKVLYIVEGLMIAENKGPLLFFYWGVSGGKKFKKWKIRLIKEKYINKELAKKNDWLAFAAEWDNESRTYVGTFVKKYYLDELPQFWTIFCGHMSLVGPRPLSILHYERDLQQGNIIRSKLKGGMLGLGHINKGTDEMGEPTYEYEYARAYLTYSGWQLMKLDIWIIWKGCQLIVKGGGH